LPGTGALSPPFFGNAGNAKNHEHKLTPWL
jgi:hypothetical protein